MGSSLENNSFKKVNIKGDRETGLFPENMWGQGKIFGFATC